MFGISGRGALLVTAVMATALGSFQFASQALSADPEKIDASISSVVSGGAWEVSGKRGTYRVVVIEKGWEHVSSSVWIQWIEEDADKKSLRLLTSIPVSQIGDLHLAVGVPEFLLSRDGTTVRLNATDNITNERTVFQLTPGKPGEYECKHSD